MSDPTAFDALNLKPELLGNLADLGYVEMTLVQAQALPRILAGEDVLARAKTGSGKTAAFSLGLLNKLDATSFRTQALVLCPTRELADQVAKEIRRLARAVANVKILTLCGGVPLGPQIASLQHHPHIVVGTPGRVLKHLGKGTLSLKNLQTFVSSTRFLPMYLRLAKPSCLAPPIRRP
jgi:ATP-independent RNA helicase DbpA